MLPDNYALAVSRLASVLKRLRGNPKLFAEYSRIIEEQSLQGIISDVDPHAPVQVGRLHYLPHHPVVREDKQTTKVRIVYDASAKFTGPSLNDCLHTGPSLISDIPDVLMRFRYHQIALAADIEKAFLMVQVAKADRDVLRFLWINDLTSEVPNIVVKRFNRVVFGVTSSPFLLNGTVRHHVSNYEVEDPQFVNDFLSSLYVDDFNGGKDSVPEAFQLYSKAKSVMEEGKSNRGMWKLGKVIDVHPGDDGLVRGATIEVASDNGKRRRLRRPLQKLFPLEVRETRVADVEEHARPIACTPQRQRRQVAIEGEMRRRQVDQCLEELKDYDEH